MKKCEKQEERHKIYLLCGNSNYSFNMKTITTFSCSHIRALVFSCIVLFCCLQTASAQPVTLDPTFGKNGMTVLFTGFGNTFVFDKSGNIIATGVAGNTVVIIKMNADGGIIDWEIYVDENYILSSFQDLKITNENKILLLGSLGETEVILRRFNEDGSIDITFGDNGIMNLSALTGAHYPIRIRSVNLENDDFMLITMTEYGDYGVASKSYTTKYNYNGELDESFGENGRAYLTDYNTFNIHPVIFATKILRDQSILIAGYDNFNPGSYSGNGKFAFCKLSPSGHFITDFVWKNDDGSEWDLGFTSIIESTTGNLLLTGSTEVGWGLVHYFIYNFYPDGTLNSGFGTNGWYRPFDMPFGLRVLQNGSKYLIRNRYNIMSINHDGTLDTTFNNTGLFRCENSTFRDMKLQDTTKLIVIGSFNDGFAIARLNIPYEPVVSVKETPYTENRITIYPNPTTGELNLIQEIAGLLNSIQYRNDMRNIEIFDVYGRKVSSHTAHRTPHTSINIAHLPTGIYFVKIITETGIQTQKVVKY